MKNIYPLLLVLLSLIPIYTFAQVDSTIGKKAPKNVSKNYKALAHHLCDSLDTDYEKVNAIYNWITYNISYDVKSIHNAKLRADKPNQVLKRKKTICGGYADLLTAMCTEMGIKAQTIEGYYKDWKFDEGDKFFKPNHAWNAVMINNKWEYLDATAGAGFTSLEPNWFQKLLGKINKKKMYTARKSKFVQYYDPAYFMQDIKESRLDRLSADPLWQLADSTMPLNIFEAGRNKINTFNNEYGAPQKFSVALSKMNKMDWADQLMESADRTYEYNPRYTSMLAQKKFVLTTYKIAKAINENSKIEGRRLLAEAKKEIAATKIIQLDQKKTIIEEMAWLIKKNKEKAASFKRYKQLVSKDNNSKMRLFKLRKKQAQAQLSKINKQKNSLRKKRLPNSVQNIELIKTLAQQKGEQTPSLQKIEDSVVTRTQRLAQSDKEFRQLLNKIRQFKKENANLGKRAATLYIDIDSLLYKETEARYQFKDDYDLEVKNPKGITKRKRLNELNQILKEYVSSYDSLKKNYDAILKLHKKQEQDYKTNIKNLEQYKKQNDKNRTLLSKYNTQILEVQEVRKKHLTSLNYYYSDMQTYIKLFDVLAEAHSRENKFFKLMNAAEEKRKELEDKKIDRDEKWLKASNKKIKNLLKDTSKEADRLFKLRHGKNQKKWKKELKKLEDRAKVNN